MGGGIAKGSLVLIGGEPGVGKSTLITKVLDNVSRTTNGIVLYVSGEESVQQVSRRAMRLDVEGENFYVLHENTLQVILKEIERLKPQFVVIDSNQTTISENIASLPASVSQVREVTYEILSEVKAKGVYCFIIGHITKEGNIAGPKILEHMVDTVIYFEGDQTCQYRILRAIKNRFGGTNEIGIFEMGKSGLVEVDNPSKYFLNSSNTKNSA